MLYKKLLLLGVLFSFLLLFVGCMTFFPLISEDTPNTLAEYLKMRKNYWYILDGESYPTLFYNDFQDYTVIIKANNGLDTYKIYKRNSLDQNLQLSNSNIKIPPECKGICSHFLYEGRKAFFFDLDIFCDKYGIFAEFIINDGKHGYIYSLPSKFFCNLENNLMCDATYYKISQTEPDFHLLDLSSVKKK